MIAQRKNPSQGDRVKISKRTILFSGRVMDRKSELSGEGSD